MESLFLEFLVQMAEWSWRSKSRTTIFDTSRENHMTHICANLVTLIQIHYKLLCGQSELSGILSKNTKMSLKVKVSDPHFQYQQLRLSLDACLMQIWWIQLKSVTSYHADKVKFTQVYAGLRTAGDKMQATTIPLWPERPRGKNG